MKRTLSIVAIATICFLAQAKAQTIKQTNIAPVTNSLSTVTRLNPINYSYDPKLAEKLGLRTNPQNGFDMEELARNYPNLVTNQQRSFTAGKNSVKTAVVPMIDHEALIPLLVGSIREQQQQIETLKAEINLLKNKITK